MKEEIKMFIAGIRVFIEDNYAKMVALALAVSFVALVPTIVSKITVHLENKEKEAEQLESNIRSETWQYQTTVGENDLERNLNGQLRWITNRVEKN